MPFEMSVRPLSFLPSFIYLLYLICQYQLSALVHEYLNDISIYLCMCRAFVPVYLLCYDVSYAMELCYSVRCGHVVWFLSTGRVLVVA
jgi:hypothetical protein